MLCRSQGVACIDGDQYFRKMTHVGGGWHAGKTTANYQVYLRLIKHARNVAYTIWPQGTFASQQAVPSTPARPANFPRQDMWAQFQSGMMTGTASQEGLPGT